MADLKQNTPASKVPEPKSGEEQKAQAPAQAPTQEVITPVTLRSAQGPVEKPGESWRTPVIQPGKRVEIKANITWKGEDDLHGEDVGGPKHTTWRGRRFKKGEAVEVNDPHLINKARNNRFFDVQVLSGEELLPPPIPVDEFRTDLNEPRSTSSVSPNQQEQTPEELRKGGLEV